jgi:hypothetical protein
MKDKIREKNQWIKKVKTNTSKLKWWNWKKNQDYGFNDKIKNKLKFDKCVKNKNL